ncbi:hypothetical protein SEVIR_9G379433v4 [Setaria viridis]|uniref:Uncharacterized protein n=1 Tax=Setaria viridis TaxID=4556 RepID=A0A4U6T2E9_SETVI|nr:hypothetical protein SEVIR_9G379433v2 [Setaria viridis]
MKSQEVGQQLGKFANETGQALSVPIGSPEERLRRGCRKMAFKMNCLATPTPAPTLAIDKVGPSASRHRASSSMARSTSRATSRGGRCSHGAALVIGSPQGAPKLESADDSDDTTNSEDDDPTYGQEEVGPSQLQGAPTPTQGSAPPKRQARGRDRTNVGSVNVLPTNPGRHHVTKKSYTPH